MKLIINYFLHSFHQKTIYRIKLKKITFNSGIDYIQVKNVNASMLYNDFNNFVFVLRSLEFL